MKLLPPLIFAIEQYRFVATQNTQAPPSEHVQKLSVFGRFLCLKINTKF
jgi:hypothetical protein